MDYQEMIRSRNAGNPFAQKLGIRIDRIAPGYARTCKTVEADDRNPMEIAHGGLLFSMADVACGSALASRGYHAVTLNAEYHFLRSAHVGETLYAEAQEAKCGKSICLYDVLIRNQDETPLGKASFTFFRTDDAEFSRETV